MLATVLKSLNESVSNLWAWLETWLDENGGVHGYVTHHHRDNLKILSPDAWTQAPCILGSLRIFQKTGKEEWLELASKMSDYLVNTYFEPLHVYQNSNHEHKPLGRPGLIDNAIASYALLEVSKEKKRMKSDWQRYAQVARDNIQNFLLPLWDESTGAFLSPAHDTPQHIHNMNSITILALTAIAELDDNPSYIEKYAKKIGKFIVSCQVRNGRMQGSYPYRDKVKNYITLYSLITSIGLFTLYRKTKSFDILVSVEEAIKHLINFVEPKTWLVCHYHKRGYPQWIPDTILLVLVSSWLENENVEVSINTSEILANVLSKQHKSGGFPLSIGFEDLWFRKGCPSRPEIKRWRDILATPNWNAWNFWALTELLPQDTEIRKPTVEFPFAIETSAEEDDGPYKIVEDKEKVIFMLKPGNRPFGFFRKKSDVTNLCLITERNECWRTRKSLEKYPKPLQKLILSVPKFF